jgi:hypothetical protein
MATVDFGTILHSFQTSAGLSEQIIIVNNAQPIATPSPFQLQIQLNPSTFKFQSALASDLGNIRFYTDSLLLEPLLSWVESGTSTSTSATIWVVLPNGLGANSSMILYMVITPNQEFDGVYAGQAPQLSSIYAQYDNGASVFSLLYQNFKGTTVPIGWTTSGSPAFNDGVTVSFVLGTTQWVYTTTTFAPSTNILDIYGYENNGGASVGNLGTGFIDVPNDANPLGWLASGSGDNLVDEAYPTIGTQTLAGGITEHIYSVAYTANGAGTFSHDYGLSESLTGGGLTGSQPISAAFSWKNAGSGTVFTQWVRVRSYPPNGVMPTATFL